MLLLSSRSLTAPQRPTRLLLSRRSTFRFWCLTPKGERTEYVRFRGSVWDGHNSFGLSCVILHAFTFTFMHCILYMWWWDLCDRCALYIVLYMSCHLVVLIGFAFAFYSDSNELYFMYSYLIHIFWVHHVGLGHISMPNSFALIVKSLYEPSMLKTSSLFIYSRLYCHQSPKRGRLKASRPLVGFQQLMMTQDYYN